jgi:hypothetical protein
MPVQGPYTNDYTNAQVSQFERLGHPGKYTTVQTITGGQTIFTGSNYGYGSVLVVTGTGLTASLSAGGTIGLTDLTAKTMYDLSLLSISGSANSGLVYVFKRQGV